MSLLKVNTLGYPRAALLAFTTAVLAYNVLVVIQAAVEAEHDLVSAGIELSSYFIAGEVTTYYGGMTVAVGPDVWGPFDDQSPAELSRALRRLAAHVDPKPCASTLAHPSPKSRRATSHAPRCNGASPPPACCAMAGCPRSDLERGGSDSLAPALHDELVDRPSTRSASGARRSRSRTPSRARASLAGRSPRRAP